jgi:hypothetical protein
MLNRIFSPTIALALLVVPILADSQPSVLQALIISPSTVDVKDSSAVINVSAQIDEHYWGYIDGYMEFRSNSGRSKIIYLTDYDYYDEFGMLSGELQAAIQIPRYSQPDEWRVHAIGLWGYENWYLSNDGYYDEDLNEWVESRALDIHLDSIGGSKSFTVNNSGPVDQQGPSLLAFGIAPMEVDVTESGSEIVISARLADELSGFVAGMITFRTPAWDYEYVYFTQDSLFGGDANDGEYEARILIPPFSAPAEWFVDSVSLTDAAGNTWYLDNSQWVYDESLEEWVEYRALDTYLDSINAPKSFVVTNLNPDLQPPTLESLSIQPTEVDVTNAGETVTLTARIADDASGFNWGYIEFISSTGGYAYASVESSQGLSGDPRDDIYQIEIHIPRYSPPGEWRIQTLYLSDELGRIRHLSNSFEYYDEDLEEWLEYRALDDYLDTIGAAKSFTVISLNPDLEPPVLLFLDINPAEVDVRFQDEVITVRAGITDDASGFNWGYLRFRSPSGHTVTAYFDGSDFQAGDYEATLYIPQFSDRGEWKADYLYLSDTFGRGLWLANEDYYEEDENGEWQWFANRALDNYLDSIGAPKLFNVISITERELGQQDVINNPGEFGLVSLSELQGAAGNQQGLTLLLGDLSQLGLFTAQDIYDLNLGGLMLQKNGNTVTLSLEMQTSTNLSSWDDGDIIMHEMEVPEDKWFIRIRALGSQ